jgi:DNA-binding transcriptional LysR family regulator
MTDIGDLVFVPPLLKRLETLGAQVKIETSQLPSGEIADRLESGEIDLACGYLPGISKSVEQAPLFRERYVCAMRSAHPITRNGGLTVKKYRDASHVQIESMGSGHPKLERTLAAKGIKREFAVSVPHYLAIPTIVSTTDLIATLPHRAALALCDLAKIRVHALPVSIPSFDVCLFWHPRFHEDPRVQWMRNLMLELFQAARTPRQRGNRAAVRTTTLEFAPSIQ